MTKRSCYIRLLIALALLSAGGRGWAQRSPAQVSPRAIIAETQQPARVQGVVRVGRGLWKCTDRMCIATSKSASTRVEACQALAEIIGPLTRFGVSAKPIPSYDLALCNVRAQIKLARIEQERERALSDQTKKYSPKPLNPKPGEFPSLDAKLARAEPAPRKPPPTVVKDNSIPPPIVVPPLIEATPAPQPRYEPPRFAMRVAQLYVLGKGTLSEMEPATPARPATGMSVAVPRLDIAGFGRLQERQSGEHLTVQVERLHVTGQ